MNRVSVAYGIVILPGEEADRKRVEYHETMYGLGKSTQKAGEDHGSGSGDRPDDRYRCSV